MIRTFAACLMVCVTALPAIAVELVMVEQPGCGWCERWDSEIAAIYPLTPEGHAAPLRRVDLRDPPDDVTFARKVQFTPTFVLIEDGVELARIEGYPGEDFFWGLLGVMLKRNTDYKGTF